MLCHNCKIADSVEHSQFCDSCLNEITKYMVENTQLDYLKRELMSVQSSMQELLPKGMLICGYYPEGYCSVCDDREVWHVHFDKPIQNNGRKGNNHYFCDVCLDSVVEREKEYSANS